jgi:hypothetical protein
MLTQVSIRSRNAPGSSRTTVYLDGETVRERR